MKKKQVINIIGFIIILAAFVFIIKTLLSFDIEWSTLLYPRYILLISLSVFIMIFGLLINTYCWRLLLSFLSKKKSDFKPVFNIYTKSNLGKYLPGNVGHYAGRQFFGISLGLRQSQLALASVLEILYNVLAAFLLSIILSWGKIFELIKIIFPSVNIILVIFAIFLTGIVFIIILYFIIRKKEYFIELLLQIKTKEFWLLFLRCVILNIINSFVIGLALAFFINSGSSFAVANFQIIIAASVSSWLIGFITPGVPGGIGVREAVLAIMLAPFYPMEVVLIAGVFQRIAFIIGDVSAWLLSILILKSNNGGGDRRHGYYQTYGRDIKARKIIAVLEDANGEVKNKKILDIGTGNGGIADYIASIGNNVTSIDTEDNIQVENYQFNFIQVDSAKIPFSDEQFDIIISNHVIEHISEQDLHLTEIYRVLSNDGVVYLANPNRIFFREVHTKLLLIHWLPNKLFFRLARLFKRYQEDFWLLSYRKIINAFKRNNFEYKDYTIEILNNPKKYFLEFNPKIKFPDFLKRISQTNIFILRKKT